MPKDLPPIAFTTLIGLLLAIGAVSHTSRYLAGQSHKVAHASMQPREPHGWDIAIHHVDGKVTYLKDYRPSYGTTRQRYRRVGK